MQAVLAIVLQILATVSAMLAIVQQLRELVVNAAKEHVPYAIETIAANTQLAIMNLTSGLAAAHTERLAIRSDIGTVLTNVAGVYTATQVIIDDIAAIPVPPDYTGSLAEILAAINGLPTPPTPPTVSAIAAGVWAVQIRVGHRADAALEAAGAFADNLGSRAAMPVHGAPMFAYDGLWNQWPSGGFSVYTPWPDWSDIRADDTMLSWLQRTDTNRTWIADPDTGLPMSRCGGPGTPGYEWTVRPTFTELPVAPFAQPPPIVIPEPIAPPVWPGIADVTLGTPVALSDGAVIPGPLDGLLLNVTGNPTGSGKFAFGSYRSWRYLGAVLFISDNGDAEWPSQIGPEQQVITPRSMKSAASAVFRLNAGFTGTVTPWVKIT